jgi:hypothetical protein
MPHSKKTSLPEVVYHKARRLADIVVPELPGQRPDREVSSGHCLVCFCPALVYNPRCGDRLRVEFTAIAEGYRHTVTLIAK